MGRGCSPQGPPGTSGTSGQGLDPHSSGCTDPQHTPGSFPCAWEQPECPLLLLGGNCTPCQRLPPHTRHTPRSHRFPSQRLWVPASHSRLPLPLGCAHSPHREDKPTFVSPLNTKNTARPNTAFQWDPLYSQTLTRSHSPSLPPSRPAPHPQELLTPRLGTAELRGSQPRECRWDSKSRGRREQLNSRYRYHHRCGRLWK